MRLNLQHNLLVYALTLAVGLLLGGSFISQVVNIRENGRELFFDKFSEADLLRSARGYIDLGFLSHYSLPKINYGTDYLNSGSLEWGLDGVYTHYPQGPNLVTGIYWKLIGEKNIFYFRILNLTFHFFSCLVLVATIASTFNLARASAFLLLLCLPACFFEIGAGLHYQGLAISFLLLQVSILLKIFTQPAGQTIRNHLTLLFLFSFIQGWLSFDYFFLVSAVAIPVALLFYKAKDPFWRRTLYYSLSVCTSGFVFAHAIHFLQVVLYYGSFQTAVSDFTDSAIHRSAGRFAALEGFHLFRTSLYEYIFVQPYRSNYFGLWYLLVPITLALCVFTDTVKTWFGLEIKFSRKDAICLFSAIAVSLGWAIVMPSHAMIHRHFIPLHLLLPYMIAGLILVKNSGIKEGEPNKTSSATTLISCFSAGTALILGFYLFHSVDPRRWGDETFEDIIIENNNQPYKTLLLGMQIPQISSISGKPKYNRKLSIYSPSSTRIRLPAKSKKLSGSCGVQKIPSGTASVQCAILSSGQILWESQPMMNRGSAQSFSIPVESISHLTLKTFNKNEATERVLMNWGNLRFE